MNASNTISETGLSPSVEILLSLYTEKRGEFVQFVRLQTSGISSGLIDAEDVLQDVIISMSTWANENDLESERDEENLRALLKTQIFTRLRLRCLDCIRGITRRTQREQIWRNSNSHDAVGGAQNEIAELYFSVGDKIRKILSDANPLYLQVFQLHFVEGRTFQEIADLLGISLNTAASRYRYALENLSRSTHLRSMLQELGQQTSYLSV